MASNVQYMSTGRRKEAVARVRIMPGAGRILVNGKTIHEYFPVRTLQLLVEQPFRETGTVGKYDVICRVHGGGLSGQAGAIRHGIARALQLADSSCRPLLKKAGLLTRDPRMKERRKYGLKKARKAPQFSKR